MICPQDDLPCSAVGLVPWSICLQACRLMAAKSILDREAKVCFNSPMTNEPIQDSILAPGGGWKTETDHPILECSDCNRAVGAAIGIAQCTGSTGSNYGDDTHHARVTWIPALDHLLPIVIPISFLDLRAAIRHDAYAAEREGFRGVAQRARETLARLDEADLATKDWSAYKVEIVITAILAP